MTGPGTTQPAPRRSAPYPATRTQWAIVAGVGIWQVVLALLAVVAVFWTWTIAERISAAVSSVHVQWIGPDFTVSATTAALLLAGVAGITGSVVQTVGVFSSRVGRRTFEGSYAWWYVLRPFAACLLAILFMAAVRAGQLGVGTDTSDGATPMLAFLAGGLAGLFTDRVLQQMRALLGATSPEWKASEQPVPSAAPPEQGSRSTQPAPI